MSRDAPRPPDAMTEAERRTLSAWMQRVGMEAFCTPSLVFPVHDSTDTAHRRTCTRLVALGVLVAEDETVPVWKRAYRPARKHWPVPPGKLGERAKLASPVEQVQREALKTEAPRRTYQPRRTLGPQVQPQQRREGKP